MSKKIEFSESQKRLINEVQVRHQKEFGDVLNMVAKEHGIQDDLQKNPSKWMFEKDWSGIFKIDDPKEIIPSKKNK